MSRDDQFILGVDLDGVVANHTVRFREIVAELRGVEPETMPLERSWDFHEWGFEPGEYTRPDCILSIVPEDRFRNRSESRARTQGRRDYRG